MGEILSPHVDRFSLVSSVIVIAVQDLDKPWPLEVYGRMTFSSSWLRAVCAIL